MGNEKDRILAVRTLPVGNAEKVVPALIAALRDKEGHVRRSAALKLGSYGEQAKDAIPALQKVSKEDPDARIRESARVALSRIDPEQFPLQAKSPKKDDPLPSKSEKQ
jgi:HEAT repeat protein